MAMLMMVMIVGLMLSALMVPMIITQDRTTRFDSTRVQALDAAQAGIDVSLGLIRASQSLIVGTSNYYGDSSKLPCGPVTGVVNGNGIAAYSVVVEYFSVDPVIYPYPSSQAMKCVTNYGTFDLSSGLSTPKYARFTSTGTVGTPTNGSTAGRTVTATYLFRTSNVNILGGIVQIAGGSVALCMDVGSPTAPAPTQVTLQPCSSSTPPAAQQVFAYRTDLTLQLSSSVTPTNLNGLCLNSLNSPPQSGDAVRLSQCGDLGTPTLPTQQWSYNDNGKFEAALPGSASSPGTLSNLCMTAATQAASQLITLSDCGSAAGWTPSPKVGAGAASAVQLGGGAMQWVNFNEYGRCLDVTGQNVNAGFLIDYPCKQNPFPSAVRWNQLFQAPVIAANQPSATGQIFTTPSAGGTQYCLTSPGINGNYVVVRPCTGSAQQSWTVYGGDKSLNYSTKYTIVNTIAGVSLCLGLSAPDPTLIVWSTIDVKTCSGATDQKWNGDPNLLNSTQQNIHEK